MPYYRRRRRHRRASAFAVALLAVLATVAVVGGRSLIDRDGPTRPSTTTLVEETIPYPEGFTPGGAADATAELAASGWTAFGVSAETLLDEIVESVGAIDRSFISRSPCGLYAMVVTGETVNLLLFDGAQWTDQSAMLAGGRGDRPTGVVTRDFTNDGVLDFLVTYRGESAGRSRPYGAVFAFPWPEERMCEWGWVTVSDGQGQSLVIQEPIVERRKTTIFGDGYRGRWSTYGRFDYDPSRHMFVFTALPGK